MVHENYKLAEMRAFDAEAYCKRYPDITQAVADGKLRDPWEHFDRRGRAEGRALCIFNEVFYLQSYSGVAEAIAEGAVETALQHYVLYGRARGYLPNSKAARPANAAVPTSLFGGLWIDEADALD